MKSKLINFFRNPTNVCTIISIMLGIILSFWLSYSAGILEKPSAQDFVKLHDQERIIIENFDEVYNLNYAKITIECDDIIINLISEENSNYLIKMKFSKNREYISSKEICNKLGYEKYPNIDRLGTIKIIFSIIVFGVVFAILLNFIISSTYWFIHSRKKRK